MSIGPIDELNPLSEVTSEDENLFEKAKGKVGDVFRAGLETEVGQTALEKAKPAFSLLEKAAIPYRNWVAPTLTMGLLMANGNYRASKSGQSFSELAGSAYRDALAEVSDNPNESWRRSVSPGRALVGLISNALPGDQLTDKIDWSNPKEVQDAFSSGAAQFWSGVGDLGFNFLDPTVVGGKLVKVAGASKFFRNVNSAKNVTKLTSELDNAVLQPNVRTGATELFKHVEDNADDIGSIMSQPFVQNASNPTLFATTLNAANSVGGRAGMRDVIKSVLGDTAATNRIRSTMPTVSANIDLINKSNAASRRTMESIGQSRFVRSGMTVREALEAEKAALLYKQAVDEIDKTKAILRIEESKKSVVENLDKGISVNGAAWSAFPTVERIRNKAAEIGYKNLFIEGDPIKGSAFYSQISAETGLPARGIRSIMWLSPKTELKELPSGMAQLGGTAGSFSYREVDSRIRTLGKIAMLSRQEQLKLSSDYKQISSKSGRFQFLEDLEERAITSSVLKHSGRSMDDLTQNQIDNINTYAKGVVRATRRAKMRTIGDTIDKNYTVVDDTGNHIAHDMLRQYIEDEALKLAKQVRGSNAKVNAADIKKIEKTLREVPGTETQIPPFHFGVDINLFDTILSEQSGAARRAVDLIVEENADKKDILELLKRAEDNATARGTGLTSSMENFSTLAKTGVNIASDALEAYYTFVWKPATLFSLKYTTRNVFEGWLRTVASMADLSTNYGYSWSDMIKGEFSDSLTATSNIRANRSAKRAGKDASKRLNQINYELNHGESAIRKSIAGTTSGAKIVKNIQKLGLDVSRKQEFKAVDGVNMPLMMLKDYVDTALNYWNPSDVISTRAANFVASKFADILFEGPKSSKYTVGTAGDFMKHLLDRDFKKAYDFSLTADPVDINRSLMKYSKALESARKELLTHGKVSSPVVKQIVDDADFMLERLMSHVDLLKVSVAKRGGLITKIDDLSSKLSNRSKIYRRHEGKLNLYGDVDIDASLAGHAGEMLRMATSSQSSSTRLLTQENRLTAFHIFEAGSRRYAIKPTDENWAVAHSEHMNNVIGKDAVSRIVIQGRIDGLAESKIKHEVVKFLRSDSQDALRWKAETEQLNMRFKQSSGLEKYGFSDHINRLMIQIELDLPSYSLVNNKSYTELLQRTLDNKFTPSDSITIPFAERHTVEGSITQKGLHPTRIYRNVIGKLFNFIGSMPEDHLVRHPFYNMVHDSEAKRQVSMLINRAKKENKNISETEIEDLVAANATRIKNTSTDVAYKELMQRLYSVERYTDTAHLLRFLTPFFMAAQNSTRFWLNTSIRNPDIAVQMAKSYNAPYRAGYVEDEEGNLKGSGNPWSIAKDTVVVSPPKFIRDYTGRDTLRVSPTAIDVVTQGQIGMLPTIGGPVFSTLGAQALQYAAKNTSADEFTRKHFGVGMDDIAQKYIMPYYEKSYGQGVLDNLIKNMDPTNSWMNSAAAYTYGKTGFALTPSAKERWATSYKSARDYITTELGINGQSFNDDYIAQKATEMTLKSLTLETISAGVGPVANFKVDDSKMIDLRQTITQYQKQYGYTEGSIRAGVAIDKAYNTSDSNAIIRNLQSKNSANKLGLIGNNPTLKNVNGNIDLINDIDMYIPDNPFLGELFNQVTGDNSYSQISDDAMYGIEINGEPLKARSDNLKQQERNAQYSSAWTMYYDGVAAIEAEAASKNIVAGTYDYKSYYGVWKDNLAAAIGERYPLWRAREEKITMSKSDQVISIARLALSNEKFYKSVGAKNPAIAGLKEYLIGRQVILDELNSNRDYTGVESLDSAANSYYLEWRDNFGQALILKFPEFKDMYNRYLAGDELNNVESSYMRGDQ